MGTKTAHLTKFAFGKLQVRQRNCLLSTLEKLNSLRLDKKNKIKFKKRFSCPFLPSWSMGLGFGSHNTRLFRFLQCLLLIKKLLMKEATKAAGWTNGLSYILNILVSSVFPSKGCGIPKLWIINYKIIKHKWSKGGRSWKCTWSRQTVAIVREEILRVTYTLIN